MGATRAPILDALGEVAAPCYDFNDEILTLGAGYWVSLVQEQLG